jgi:hypothetical protein
MNGYEVMKQVGKCPECGCTEFVINSEVSGTVSYLVSLVGEGYWYGVVDIVINFYICANKRYDV